MMETTALADGTAVPHTANPAAAPGSRLRRAIRGMLSGIDAPGGLVDKILAGRGLGATWLRLCAVMTVGAAAYGAACGMWSGARLAVYAAIKLPLVLLLPSA